MDTIKELRMHLRRLSASLFFEAMGYSTFHLNGENIFARMI